MKKSIAFAMAFAFALLLAGAPYAHARRGADDIVAQPPECQVEDGGVIVCQ